jgi:hypothetical protein
MKISELIEKLQHQKNLWGDLPVVHNIGVCYEPTYEEIEVVQPFDDGPIGKPPTSMELC